MKSKELFPHIQNFAATGIIDDALIPCYDQDGRWRGYGIRKADPDQHPALQKIGKSILPESRRTRTSRLGTVLLTSFHCCNKNPLTLCYCEIQGDLAVSGNVSIHGANLRHIGGHFLADTDHRIYFPQLTTVGGNFEAVKGFKLMAHRLREVGGNLVVAGHIPPRIESVGGRLGVYWIFTLQADHLRRVGGALLAPKAEAVVVPVLESIGGGFLLNHMTRKVQAPCLRSVGGDFLAETVTDMRVPRLRAVGGDLDSRSAKGYYHPEVRVAGEWTICPGAMEDWAKRLAARLAIRGHTAPLYL